MCGDFVIAESRPTLEQAIEYKNSLKAVYVRIASFNNHNDGSLDTLIDWEVQ